MGIHSTPSQITANALARKLPQLDARNFPANMFAYIARELELSANLVGYTVRQDIDNLIGQFLESRDEYLTEITHNGDGISSRIPEHLIAPLSVHLSLCAIEPRH